MAELESVLNKPSPVQTDRAGEAALRAHVPENIDVKASRARLGLTQHAFASRFGFSVNALRHWEQGTRRPESPTRAYLLVIDMIRTRS